MSSPSDTPALESDPRPLPCWCGADRLEAFSPAYNKCAACGTLVVARMPAGNHARVDDDARDFYGAHYHITERYGYPSVLERARTDLPERCLHWLRAVLRHRRPPARALDVGCGHGAFVALLRWAGFDALGVELSPTIVEYAQRVFGVPILQGQLAEQEIDPASFDVIALMDVVEHFPDPPAALRDCVSLLADDGLFFLQTPRFPEEKSYAELVDGGHPFLQMMREDEHLYLFSERALTALLARLGLSHTRFEPAIFAHYDMFLVASRGALEDHRNPVLDLDETLPPEAHLVEALFALDDQRLQLTQRLAALGDELKIAQEHAAQRLELIQRQGDQLGVAKGERNFARLEVENLIAQLRAAERDRDVNGRCAEENAARAATIHAEKSQLATQLADAERREGELRRALRARETEAAQLSAENAVLREERQRRGWFTSLLKRWR